MQKFEKSLNDELQNWRVEKLKTPAAKCDDKMGMVPIDFEKKKDRLMVLLSGSTVCAKSI